jgi:hypothetical protein
MPICWLAAYIVLTQAAAPADPVSLTPTQSTLSAGVLSGAWQLKDGELVGRAEPGQMSWYRLPGEYWDFEFEAEFMTPAPANGGVQFRAHWLPQSAADGAGPKTMHGYQANVDTREPGHTGEILIAHGQPPLSAATKDAQASVKPSGWNTIAIRAAGPVAEVRINGIPAATVYDETFIGGHIALEVRSGDTGPGEVRYRNMRVRNLGRAGDWRPLFDGTSLAGWKIWGTEDFHVKDGRIECRRGPKESEGYLATEETWSNFRVRGRFHMLGDGNYGLFFHSTIKLRDDGYPVIAGVQGEVEPSWPGSTGWAYESYRRGWLIQPDKTSPAAMVMRPGEWNEIEIRRQGNRLTTWVNGFRVMEWLDPAPQLFSGSFALQLHTGAGAGIDWRDLYVIEP